MKRGRIGAGPSGSSASGAGRRAHGYSGKREGYSKQPLILQPQADHWVDFWGRNVAIPQDYSASSCLLRPDNTQYADADFLNGVAPGNEHYQRSGDAIMMTKCSVRGRITLDASVAITGSYRPPVVTISLCLAKNPAGQNDPPYADLYQQTTQNGDFPVDLRAIAFRNRSKSKTVQVLKRISVVMNPGCDGSTLADYRKEFEMHYNFGQTGKEVNFGGSTFTSASLLTNGLFLVVTQNTAITTLVGVDFISRVEFRP